MSGPWGAHCFAHGASAPLLCQDRRRGGGGGRRLDGSIKMCRVLVNLLTLAVIGGGVKPWASLGVNERSDGEEHPSSHRAQLQMADVPTRENLRDEEVIHVGQREQRQSEEEEGASPLAVRGVVVPEDQAGQGGQDDDAQQVVQRCGPEQQRQQHQGRDHGDLQVVYQGPENRRGTSAVGGFVSQPPAAHTFRQSYKHLKVK